MDFEHREQIIKDMGMCIKCLDPRYTLKTRAERLKHEQNECSVAKRKRRNRYICLNEECFLHSCVCTLHRDENQPLFETHTKEFIKKRQTIVFADPGMKHWHSNTPSKKFNIAQPGPDNHTPKPGHDLADILTLICPQGYSLPDPTQHLTPEYLSPVPTAHQTSRFTDVTDDLGGANDIIPDDGLEMPVMLARIKNLTTEDVISIIAAFKRGLLNQWNAHGHLPLAIQNTPFEEDAHAGLLPKITILL
jgi:hypothetical protein